MWGPPPTLECPVFLPKFYFLKEYYDLNKTSALKKKLCSIKLLGQKSNLSPKILSWFWVWQSFWSKIIHVSNRIQPKNVVKFLGFNFFGSKKGFTFTIFLDLMKVLEGIGWTNPSFNALLPFAIQDGGEAEWVGGRLYKLELMLNQLNLSWIRVGTELDNWGYSLHNLWTPPMSSNFGSKWVAVYSVHNSVINPQATCLCWSQILLNVTQKGQGWVNWNTEFCLKTSVTAF